MVSFRLASINFLLLASLALSSMGVYPHLCAKRCAALVLPTPGGPESRSARKTPMAFLPGFLKFALYDACLAARDGRAEMISMGSEGAAGHTKAY